MATAAASSRVPTAKRTSEAVSSSLGLRLAFRGSAFVDDAAVAALALLKVEDRLEEVALAEVGPERGGDPDLAVRDLPEQEVGDAHLAARAYEQVRIGKPRGAEPRPERLFVDLLGRQPTRSDVVGEGAAGVHDLGPAAVVERDVERHATAGRRPRQSLAEGLLDRRVELIHPTDDAEPDVVLE